MLIKWHEVCPNKSKQVFLEIFKYKSVLNHGKVPSACSCVNQRPRYSKKGKAKCTMGVEGEEDCVTRLQTLKGRGRKEEGRTWGTGGEREGGRLISDHLKIFSIKQCCFYKYCHSEEYRSSLVRK